MRSLGTVGLGMLGAGLMLAGVATLDMFAAGAPADIALFEVAAVIAAIGTLLLLSAHWRMRHAGAAPDDARQSVGTITRIQKAALQDPAEEPAYVVHFRYEDDLQAEHAATAALPQTEAFRYQPGDTGIVRYAAAYPRDAVWIGGLPVRHSIEVPSSANSGAEEVSPPSLSGLANRSADLKDGLVEAFFAALVAMPTAALWLFSRHGVPWTAILAALVLLFLVWQAVRSVRAGLRHIASAQRLLREGAPAQAVIAQVIERPRYIGATTSITWSAWVIEYVFQDAAGRKRHGVSEASTSEARGLRVGDTIAVRYDPVAPKASVWLGKLA